VPGVGESLPLAELRQIWPAYFASPDDAPPMPDIDLSPDAYAGVLASVTQELPRLSAGLGTIAVPFGFVAGGSSPLSPDDAAGPTCTAMPNAWLEVVPGAGHFVWVERPGRVIEGLDRLVAG
ncbi:MAG: alpha/beta fold hydrolase, partial [Acidimicrobiales bacterium]